MRNLLSPVASLRALLPFVCVLALAMPQVADARQMDPKAVAGIPLPVPDVAVGTVVVRVIKGTLTNNVPNQQVELLGAGAPRAVTTDAGGRAEFSGLAPGSMVTAVATVGGERLQSQQFAVPANGGTRLLLVATDPAGGAAARQRRQARVECRRSRERSVSTISRASFSSSATAAFRSSISCRS